jgi:uncharacterized membrane protein YuzA (DUF378 family)
MWKCILLGAAFFAGATLLGLAQEDNVAAKYILIGIGSVVAVVILGLLAAEIAEDRHTALKNLLEACGMIFFIACGTMPMIGGMYVAHHSRPLYGWLVGIAPYAIFATVVCCIERRKNAERHSRRSHQEDAAQV